MDVALFMERKSQVSHVYIIYCGSRYVLDRKHHKFGVILISDSVFSLLTTVWILTAACERSLSKLAKR